MPLLAEREMSAAFFITTAFVSQRRGYCDWAQVRSLAEHGMLVGAHGHTHRFLSGLGDAQLRQEFQLARDLLHDRAGVTATQLSFPGGRFDQRAVKLAYESGFQTLFGSRFGTISTAREFHSEVLPRLAMRPGLTQTRFLGLARSSSRTMLVPRLSALMKDATRRLVGDERYHQIYRYLRG